jgi:hypothetical protein
MASIIEQNLPANFLQPLGAYLQTCAHIELRTTVLILEIERRYRSPPFKKDMSFPMLRKKTAGNLINKLKDTLLLLPQHQQVRLQNVLTRLEDGKLRRDTATHGAFYYDALSQSIKVNFLNKVGDQFVEEQALISSELTSSLLEEADSIYLEITALSKEVISWVGDLE